MQLKKIYYLSGTHWDREWYKPFQGFRYMLIGVLDEVIDTLEKQPEFGMYMLDGQTAVLDDYCEIARENRERLSRLVSEGRIAVGPWYVMPDEFLCSGESIIENLLLGHRKAREYGAVGAMPYGYICDIFGHIAQMPQILRGFHIPGALMQRGCNQDTTPPHFWWQSPDGSRVHAYRTPEDFGYGAFYHYATEAYIQGWDTDKERLFERAVKEIDRECQSLNAPYLVLHDALDHQRINKAAPWLAERLSKHYGCPVEFATLDHMAHEIERDALTLPVREGELAETAHKDEGTNILLTYILSSRYDIKKENDETQNLWEKWVDPLMGRAALSGHAVRRGFRDVAYLELLRCHAHDSICGCAVQDVHRDMKYRYRQARTIGEEIVTDCMRYDLSSDDTRNGGEKRILRLYNPLPYARREAVKVKIGLDKDFPRWFSEGERPNEQKPSFDLFDREGNAVPFTFLRVMRDRIHPSPTQYFGDFVEILLRAELAPMAYTEYEIRPAEKTRRTRNAVGLCRQDGILENEYLRVRATGDGTISLVDKQTGKTYRDLLSLRDNGEIGDGWMHIRPMADRVVSSIGAPCVVELAYDGAGGSALRITKTLRLPSEMVEEKGETYRSERYVDVPVRFTVHLSAADRYVTIDLEIDNTARDHRLRLCLPTDTEGNEYSASQTFAFIKRPCGGDGRTWDWKEPQTGERNFDGVLYKRGGDGAGLAFVSGAGLHEAAVMDDERHTMLVTLFRAFEKTIGTNGGEDGQLLGSLSFRFRLTPLDASVSMNQLIRMRDELQAEARGYVLRVRGDAPLCAPCSFLAVDSGACAVSAVKLPDDGAQNSLIVRLVQYGDEPEACVLAFARPIRTASYADLLETPQAPCACQGHTVSVACKPWQIVTLRVEMA